MKITEQQVIAAEEIASDVFDKKLKRGDGAEILSNIHGLNINSANDFINDYKYMMLGKTFKRALSAPAIDYFLDCILDKRGSEFHSLALRSAEQHVKYYEDYKGTKLRKIKKVLDAHRLKSAPRQLSEHFENFEEAVQNSLSDSVAARSERLCKADKLPTKIPVVTYAFLRNPDVVAEVLIRANGKCEHCKNSAPFKRKKNLKPYLEVHHVIQLSLGGEDTVENAMALCPNCHRYLHFGLVSNPIMGH